LQISENAASTDENLLMIDSPLHAKIVRTPLLGDVLAVRPKSLYTMHIREHIDLPKS
jgi:hypothetical protein